MLSQNQSVKTFVHAIAFSYTRGKKFFELVNHLGNVWAVISDKKIAYSSNGTTVAYYQADVVSATDYYPSGMVSRSVIVNSTSPGYRYSMHGKENDGDVKGDGNLIDCGARVHDPRIVRFLSIDPLQQEYPELAPYQFASNTPIWATDTDGEEAGIVIARKFFSWWVSPADERSKQGLADQVNYNHVGVNLTGKDYQGLTNGGYILQSFGQTLVYNAGAWGMGGHTGTGVKVKTPQTPHAEANVHPSGRPTLEPATHVETPDVASKVATAANGGNDGAANASTATTGQTTKSLIKNKNFNDAEGNFVLYEISENNQKLQIGKADADRVTATGDPVRMKASERKARKNGYPNATATIVQRLGTTTTRKAKSAEAFRVKNERADGHALPLNKEKDKKYHN